MNDLTGPADVAEIPDSATQNLDLLLNAFDDVTQTVDVNDVKESDRKEEDEADDDWEEMCDFLTQKNRVMILQSCSTK